jgi:hypothetical protein
MRRAVEGRVSVARVGDGDVLLVRVDRRRARDGGSDWGRADPLQTHGWRLGLLQRRVRALLVLWGRRRRGGRAGGELLDHVAELVPADVVDLRLRLRRAGGSRLLGRRRGRGLPDGAAELVDPEVLDLAGGGGAAGGAIHGEKPDRDREEPVEVWSIQGGGGGGGHGPQRRARA